MEFEALALFRAGVLAGEYYEASNEEGELIGYTMWMPPGREMFSTFVFFIRILIGMHSQTHDPHREEQRKCGFYEFMSKLSPEAESYFKTKVNLRTIP
jgi:hypothetical protein